MRRQIIKEEKEIYKLRLALIQCTMNWQMQIQSHQNAMKTQPYSWQSSFMVKEVSSSLGLFLGLCGPDLYLFCMPKE